MNKGGIFVTAAPGKALGITDAREAFGGVEGAATLREAYSACLWSRVGLRVLWRIAETAASNADELYEGIRGVDWSTHMGESDTLAVDFSGSVTGIDNSQFGALRVKDAIVDQFRENTGERPSVDRVAPALRVNVHVARCGEELKRCA